MKIVIKKNKNEMKNNQKFDIILNFLFKLKLDL